MTAAWEKFILHDKTTGATLSLLKNERILKPDNKVEIQLKSPIEKNLLAKINDDIIKLLRNELKNDHIIITCNVNMAIVQKKAYTSAEIFNEMAEKNPELLKLKDALGLDTEF